MPQLFSLDPRVPRPMAEHRARNADRGAWLLALVVLPIVFLLIYASEVMR